MVLVERGARQLQGSLSVEAAAGIKAVRGSTQQKPPRGEHLRRLRASSTGRPIFRFRSRFYQESLEAAAAARLAEPFRWHRPVSPRLAPECRRVCRVWRLGFLSQLSRSGRPVSLTPMASGRRRQVQPFRLPLPCDLPAGFANRLGVFLFPNLGSICTSAEGGGSCRAIFPCGSSSAPRRRQARAWGALLDRRPLGLTLSGRARPTWAPPPV